MGVASLLCENVHKRNGCMKNEEAHAIWEKKHSFRGNCSYCRLDSSDAVSEKMNRMFDFSNS